MAGPGGLSGWSQTVAGAINDAGEAPVPVTTLIDGVLTRHSSDYLREWTSTPPAWPTGMLRQPAQQWAVELEELLNDGLVFGRIAVVGWCLLDDEVARAASACGLLAGLAREVDPHLTEFLAPAGVRLLRRRAPVAALAVDLLPADVDLQGVVGGGALQRIALARTSTSARGVGAWAAAAGQDLYVGLGSRSRPIMEESRRDPSAMAFSRGGDLLVLGRQAPGLLRYRPATGQVVEETAWPGVAVAAASESGVAAVVGATATRSGALQIVWGLPDGGGGPVELPEFHREVTRLLVAGEHVAAMADGDLWFGGADREWGRSGFFEPVYAPSATTMAADESGVAVGGGDGIVNLRPWEPGGTGNGSEAAPWRRVPALPGQQLTVSSRGGGRTVVASENEVAVVRGDAVEARWRPDEGKTITAVALSPDGDTLAVAGTLMLKIWRLDAAPEIRLTSYTADTPDGEDLLGVQPTVDALAALIAARAVEPPLSVGLFGAWGSGKSFFMRRVEERVREITEESRSSMRPQASIWAWRNIRHVRFNAWQYAAADVWAGLLEQLVRELARRPRSGELELELPPELSEIERLRIERLAGGVAKADQAAEELRTARRDRNEAAEQVATAQAELRTAKAEAAKARASATHDIVGEGVVSALDEALGKAGLPPLGRDVRDTWARLQEARRSTESVGALVAGQRGVLKATLVAAPLLGLAVAVLWIWANAAAPGLSALVSSLLTLIVGGVVWLTRRSLEVQTRLQRIEEAEAAARAVEEEARLRQAEARTRLRDAAAAVEEARHRVEVAEEAVAAARAKVVTATPGSLVEEYLAGRHSSEDYRAMLGLIGVVRRDLDVIATGVQLHNQRITADGEPLDDVVNRVVLYVDDLDRCRPEVVVKVLEAVAMLMSFPLFVVVVAVDSHWIARSLLSVYPDMLTDDQVTTDHYLEKIFQLPVWLDQPAPEAVSTMARTLLGSTNGNGHTPAPEGGAAPNHAATDHPVAASSTAATAPEAVPTSAALRNIALATTPPQSILLEESESAAIATLAPLLTRSPRALKRYLNTYRLLKALVDPASLRLARVLLAISTGRPRLGEQLCSAIGDAPADTTLGSLVDRLAPQDRDWLAAYTDTSWRRETCASARPVVAQVRRFVFRTDLRSSEGSLGRAASDLAVLQRN